MTQDESRAIYRAIDDLKALMNQGFDSMREQLSSIRKLDDDVEQLKIDRTAMQGIQFQHEKRITMLEGKAFRWLTMVIVPILCALIGAGAAFVVTHL